MAFLTDQALLEEIQYDVIEAPDLGATFPSGVWTAAEVLALLNLRQRQFVRESRIVVGRTSFVVGAGVERTDIEAIGGLEDVFQILRVAIVVAGAFHEVPASDLFAADHGSPTWAGTSLNIPLAYSVTDGLTTELILVPAPTLGGTVWLHFIPRLPTLTRIGDPLAVPSEFTLGIKWGILSDLLGKSGRIFDPQRAAVCQSRYEDVVSLSRQMVEGMI